MKDLPLSRVTLSRGPASCCLVYAIFCDKNRFASDTRIVVKVIFKRIATVVALILLGAALTLLGNYFLLSKMVSISPEEVRRKHVLEYSSKEQAAIGKNCRDLGSIVRETIVGSFQPVLAGRVQGGNGKR